MFVWWNYIVTTVPSNFLNIHICCFCSLYFHRCCVFLKVPSNLIPHLSSFQSSSAWTFVAFLTNDHPIPWRPCMLLFISKKPCSCSFSSISPLFQSGNIGTPQRYLLNPLIVCSLSLLDNLFLLLSLFRWFQDFCL